MAATLNLGQLCLSYPRAELQLTADVLLTASSPQATNGRSSPTNIARSLISRSAWVCRGRGFHLALDVSVDGSPADSNLQQHLGNSICRADLWDQLGVRACLLHQPVLSKHAGATKDGKFAVHLTRSADTPLSVRHRLPTGASIADVQPPPGVQTLHLESVQMTLDLLSTVCSGKRETRRATEVQTQDFSPTSILMHEDEHHVGYDCQATIAQEEIMLLDDLPGKVADATLSTEDELLHSNTSTSVPQRIDSGTAFMDDQLSKGDAALHELRRASPERILELVDSALRLAICEKPLRLPFGIKLIRDNVTRLASVAPALWRAHHLRAVSERSPFIPTIAHALSHSVIANARSDPLKRKAAELLDHYKPAANRTGPLSPDDAQQRRDPDFVYEAVSIGLWDLLQRSHFDSGANSRLKPLKTRPRDIDAKDLNDNDEMLYGNNSQFLLDLNPLVNEGGSDNSIPSFQDHKRKDLLWEWNDKYQDTRTDSAHPTSMAPFGNRARPEIFDMGETDQVMPLDWDEEVHFDPNTASGNTFEAQDPSSKTNTHVSESFCDIDAGVSFEAKGPIETHISTDACDNLAAVSEMIFN